jgi:hypothetical protein
MRTSQALRAAWALSLATLALLLSSLLAGCGGGVGSGGTGTYASGPITGFGSIIVAGVRYDESGATVLDDDDQPHSGGDLKLGMLVAIDGDAVRTEAGSRVATASRVRFGSELVGPVTAVDVAAGRFTLLGQSVRVAVDTVFDERLSGGLAGLAVGQPVEVYGLYDAANGRYDATRIAPRSSLASWVLRGPVAALDTAARTLRIGGATVSYAAASNLPADLAAGRIVRLRLQTSLDGSGRFVASSFGTGLRLPEDRERAELEGLITSFSSPASFAVNGLPVDGSSASFPDGTAGLRLGARVEVEGALREGLLRASVVEIETDDRIDDRGFELRGRIESVNASARTFVLRGQAISWARADLRLDNGTLADLVIGREVDVKGRPSADRTVLEATRITFR